MRECWLSAKGGPLTSPNTHADFRPVSRPAAGSTLLVLSTGGTNTCAHRALIRGLPARMPAPCEFPQRSKGSGQVRLNSRPESRTVSPLQAKSARIGPGLQESADWTLVGEYRDLSKLTNSSECPAIMIIRTLAPVNGGHVRLARCWCSMSPLLTQSA